MPKNVDHAEPEIPESPPTLRISSQGKDKTVADAVSGVEVGGRVTVTATGKVTGLSLSKTFSELALDIDSVRVSSKSGSMVEQIKKANKRDDEDEEEEE